MIAIKKHMQTNLPDGKKWMNATFLTSLKTGVKNGEFIQTKYSYKLSAQFKKKRADALKPKLQRKKLATTGKKSTKKIPPKKSVSWRRTLAPTTVTPIKKAIITHAVVKKSVLRKSTLKTSNSKKSAGKKTTSTRKATKRTDAKKKIKKSVPKKQ